MSGRLPNAVRLPEAIGAKGANASKKERMSVGGHPRRPERPRWREGTRKESWDLETEGRPMFKEVQGRVEAAKRRGGKLNTAGASSELRFRERLQANTEPEERPGAKLSATGTLSELKSRECAYTELQVNKGVWKPKSGEERKLVQPAHRVRGARAGASRAALESENQRSQCIARARGLRLREDRALSAELGLKKVDYCSLLKADAYPHAELLRAQGIAPPEVRPEAAATPTEVVDLTADDDDAVEIKQLEASRRVLRCRSARLRVLKKKSVKVKSESSGVKQERSSMFAPGEVIDLT
ncbi:hypothetical protein B0H14DRAFT_3163049 [Mycena olivaceomarginata]|nr:hypothetical protein B0H14DRAFT_3163049 [Mycena olivaceomarginata]